MFAIKRPFKPVRRFEIFGSVTYSGYGTFPSRHSIKTIWQSESAEQQAVSNAKAIAASIEPFYGAGARDGFFKLLAGHYGAVKAYLWQP